MTYDTIALQREDSIYRLTLMRPPLNILNIAMMKEMIDAFTSIRDARGVTLLVIDANGKAFSAGVDVLEHAADVVDEMMHTFGAMFRSMAALPFPTLAVVRGAALGGGCELAIFCDMIVASEKAQFGQPETKVGVFPPIAAAIFPRLIGRNRAIEWLCTGDVMSAAEAERIGLINKVFPLDGFDDAVNGFIARFSKLSATVLASTKRAIDFGAAEATMMHIDAAEKFYLADLMKTHDANEGIQAFIEKRAAIWKHE